MILKCYEKAVKGNYFGKFIANNAYKSVIKYFDGQVMDFRVNSTKVKNR